MNFQYFFETFNFLIRSVLQIFLCHFFNRALYGRESCAAMTYRAVIDSIILWRGNLSQIIFNESFNLITTWYFHLGGSVILKLGKSEVGYSNWGGNIRWKTELILRLLKGDFMIHLTLGEFTKKNKNSKTPPGTFISKLGQLQMCRRRTIQTKMKLLVFEPNRINHG